MPLFQKRHYEAVAKEFNRRLAVYRKDGADPTPVCDAMYVMANVFANENPMFNHGMFINACMKEHEDATT